MEFDWWQAALSTVNESGKDRMYAVRRFITVHRTHALVAWVHRVQRDESLDGIKCGPYPGEGLNDD